MPEHNHNPLIDTNNTNLSYYVDCRSNIFATWHWRDLLKSNVDYGLRRRLVQFSKDARDWYSETAPTAICITPSGIKHQLDGDVLGKHHSWRRFPIVMPDCLFGMDTVTDLATYWNACQMLCITYEDFS